MRCVRCLLLALVVGGDEILLLLLDAVLATDPGILGLAAAGLGLVLEELLAGGLGLALVNELHQDTLVLEDVTLGLEVELVVQVAVDLLGLAVRLEHTAEDTLAADPHHLGRHTRVCGTATLTVAGVAALGLGGGVPVGARARVDNIRLLDDQTVLDQLGNVLPWKDRGGGRRGGVSKWCICCGLCLAATKRGRQPKVFCSCPALVRLVRQKFGWVE